MQTGEADYHDDDYCEDDNNHQHEDDWMLQQAGQDYYNAGHH